MTKKKILTADSQTQSAQPKKYYEYDGITGFWLWLPWWFHLFLGVITWPLFLFIAPKIAFNNPYIMNFIRDYKLEAAEFTAAFFVVSAFLSFYKAWQIKQKNEVEFVEKSKINHQVNSKPKIETKPKAEVKQKVDVKQTAKTKTESKVTVKKAVDAPKRVSKTTKKRTKKSDQKPTTKLKQLDLEL